MFAEFGELKGNKRASNYLKAVISELKKVEEKVVSVILFGSLAKGGTTKLSDVDLLVVLDDESTPGLISKIDETLTKIENEYGYGESPEGFTEKLVFCVKRRTGMFVSHFVCRERDFKDKDFPEIFSTEKFLSSLIAPGDLVLNNLGQEGKILYGKNLLDDLDRLATGVSSLIRSLLMNLLTAISTVLILPFYRKATELSAEVIKWSLLAVHQYMTRHTGRVDDAINLLNRLGFYDPDVLDRLKYLRSHMEEDPLFVFKAPQVVIGIHMKGLSQRRG